MKIYRHKEDKNLYIIEHLILDIKHLNNNEFSGIYAEPYKWNGNTIIFQNKNHNKCLDFINNNFEAVSEL